MSARRESLTAQLLSLDTPVRLVRWPDTATTSPQHRRRFLRAATTYASCAMPTMGCGTWAVSDDDGTIVCWASYGDDLAKAIPRAIAPVCRSACDPLSGQYRWVGLVLIGYWQSRAAVARSSRFCGRVVGPERAPAPRGLLGFGCRPPSRRWEFRGAGSAHPIQRNAGRRARTRSGVLAPPRPGESNGSTELSDGVYIWPAGLSHYVTRALGTVTDGVHRAHAHAHTA